MSAIDPVPDETQQAEPSIMDDLAAPAPAPGEGGFSLASLFLLVTASGVMALLARAMVETELDVRVMGFHAAAGALIGGIAGAIIGAGYPRPLASALLGWMVGTLAGAVSAATAASGGTSWLFLIGAVALVALGIASRWMLRR